MPASYQLSNLMLHTMVFTKDTTFLNLVRGERDHENYGITHTIRHVFVDEKEKNLLLECYKFECRSCGSTDLKRVVSWLSTISE